MQTVKEDVIKTAEALQLYIGQEAGSKAAIHETFNNDRTETILLVDSEIACNTINRKVLLDNTEYLCPELATFIYNC